MGYHSNERETADLAVINIDSFRVIRKITAIFGAKNLAGVMLQRIPHPELAQVE